MLVSICNTYVQHFLDYCGTLYDEHVTFYDNMTMRLERAQNTERHTTCYRLITTYYYQDNTTDIN